MSTTSEQQRAPKYNSDWFRFHKGRIKERLKGVGDMRINVNTISGQWHLAYDYDGDRIEVTVIPYHVLSRSWMWELFHDVLLPDEAGRFNRQFAAIQATGYFNEN